MSVLRVTQDFFDTIAPGWDYHFKPQKRSYLRSIISGLLPQIKQPVLDIGCGCGILLDVLPAGMNPVCLDLSLEMLEQTKTNHSAVNPKLLQADGHYLPFADNCFSTVFCFQVFPHFHSSELVMDEVRRILAKNGNWIILHLMDHQQLNQLHRDAGKEVAEDILPPASVLSERLADRGFRIQKSVEKEDLYLIVAQNS